MRVPAGQVPELGVFAGPDPILDGGVRAVPGLQERELPQAVLFSTAW